MVNGIISKSTGQHCCYLFYVMFRTDLTVTEKLHTCRDCANVCVNLQLTRHFDGVCFEFKNVNLICCFVPKCQVLIMHLKTQERWTTLFSFLFVSHIEPPNIRLSLDNITYLKHDAYAHFINWGSVWSTWRCSLVGDCSFCTLRDCSVTDGHHGHELLDDSSCRLQEVERALWLKVFFNKTCCNKTETKQLEKSLMTLRERKSNNRESTG